MLAREQALPGGYNYVCNVPSSRDEADDREH